MSLGFPSRCRGLLCIYPYDSNSMLRYDQRLSIKDQFDCQRRSPIPDPCSLQSTIRLRKQSESRP